VNGTAAWNASLADNIMLAIDRLMGWMYVLDGFVERWMDFG